MNRYTQEGFNALPIVDGVKICPTGDYMGVYMPGDKCSFGERCSFGEGCSHEGLTNSNYIAIDRIGSALRKAYFFCAEEGYFVRAGCWFGTFDDFVDRVNKMHGDTTHERDYLAALQLAKIMLGHQDNEVRDSDKKKQGRFCGLD